MANMIHLEINGKSVEVPQGTNLLNAARAAGINIPNLCYHPDLKPGAACGLCICRQLVPDRKDPSKLVVSPKMLRACCTEATEGMKIITHDPEISAVRKTVLELILANHPNECLQCRRNGSCELQSMAAAFGILNVPFPTEVSVATPDASSCSIVLDPRKCIKCGRCVEVCQHMQDVWALEFIGRGEKTLMKPAADASLTNSPCVRCGQCITHCPVGAIFEKDDTIRVAKALQDPSKYCVVQMAPSVRVALGEEFGLPSGSIVTGQLYAALRAMGYKKVFDTNFGADATIMEEGFEFIERLNGKGAMPQFTSCCPGWVDWCEKYAPDFLENLSTTKSPMQIESALIKTYFAEREGIDPKDIFVVAIMPCTAKKWEIKRSKEMAASGQQDTDVVLTTRELARMCKTFGIDPSALPEEPVDSLLGTYSGAGTIFGFTGGVMEAALRTAYCVVSGEATPPVLEFKDIRTMEGIKEATITIPKKDGTKVDVKVAVVHQLSNVEPVLEQIRSDRAAGVKPRYDFVEVMACRGGCIGGGGQPYGTTDEVRANRTKGLMTDDERCTVRLSHENPEIKTLYSSYLEAPLCEKSHHLLHTTYSQRQPYAN